MSFLNTISISTILLVAVFTAAGLVLGLILGLRRESAALVAMREKNEVLRDEIWALRDEAAARGKAEAASDAKSRFLATVSHEIRTPLNGVLGLADLLQATDLTREQASYVDAIKSSGEALTSIIHEILDFSRIEAGHLDLHPESMSLHALVEGVAELLAPRAQGKGLEIAAWVSSNLPQRVVFDAARVRQVLLNLAGNAIKFTPAGGVGISVEPVDDDTLRFAVVDTGPGIAPGQRALIFNEFETGDNNETRSEGGTGLGLAISQRIVQRMGGSLNLEASEGPGAHFHFNIPLQRDPTVPQHAPRPVLPPSKILVVAKSPFEAPFLAQRLREAGADVEEIDDADVAKKMLARTAFDVLIVDCALGEKATEQVAATARAYGVHRALVLFSPFERHAFGQKVAAGFDGWLVKPVRADSLLQRVWPENYLPQNALPQPLGRSETGLVALPGARLKVLLAEDNEISLLVARKMLERLGIIAVCVGDGQAAISAFDEAAQAGAPFDACIFDIRMPKINGLQAARYIRNREAEHAAVPTTMVALSANAFDEDKATALSAGFNNFIVKPIVASRLTEALQDLRGRSPAAA